MKKSIVRFGFLIALLALAGCGAARPTTGEEATQPPGATATPAPACTPGQAGQTAAAPDAAPTLFVEQDVLYALSDDSLLAINTADGSQRWQIRAADTVLTAAHGTLYLGAPGIVNPTVNPNGTVEALSADTGAERWHASIQSGPCGCTTGGLARLLSLSGAIGMSRPLVFNGMVAIWLDGITSALDASTGEALWQASVGSDYQAFLVAG